MTGAIAERGEDDLVLAEITYRLRPSHAAMRGIERKLERSALELVRMGHVGALTNDQLGVIAAELIRAGAEDDETKLVHADRIGELIYEESLARVTFRLTAILSSAVSGGRDAAGNRKAATA